jgi:hypothetical protein
MESLASRLMKPVASKVESRKGKPTLAFITGTSGVVKIVWLS